MLVEVNILKMKSGSAWKYEIMNHDTPAYLMCKPGYYDLKIEEAGLNCGIAQILIQLCLNEENLHDVKNRENQAMFALRTWSFRYGFLMWVRKHCEKVVFTNSKENLEGFVGISKLASAILQAAILSQYSDALIKLPNLPYYFPYPPGGFTFTTDLLGRYDGKKGMVKEGKVVNIDKTEWFFCLRN